MSNPPAKKTSLSQLAKRGGPLLEAEVAPAVHTQFQNQYTAATGQLVVPGNPEYYQDQPNKWGAELRVYFNGATIAESLQADDIHVEHRPTGYRSGEYEYRFNDNDLWWELVEKHGLRLGPN